MTNTGMSYTREVSGVGWAGVKVGVSKQSKVEDITLQIPQTNLIEGKIRGLLNRDVDVQTAEVIGKVSDKSVITMKT